MRFFWFYPIIIVRVAIVLIALLTLLASVGYKTAATAGINIPKIEQMRKMVIRKAYEPLNQIRQKISLKRLTFNDNRVTNNRFEELGSSADFKWIFETEGISLSSPAVDDNGSVYVSITSLDFGHDPDIQNFEESNFENPLFNIKTTLYSLQSNSELKTGNENWSFSAIKGASTFSPVILANGTILVESIVGLNNPLETPRGKLFAVDQNGKAVWNNELTFDGEVFPVPPVVGRDGTILITKINTLGTPDPVDIVDVIENLSTSISSVNFRDGSIIWTFDPNTLSDEETLIVLAPPVISTTGDTAFISAINTTNLRVQDKINEFISNFEDEVQIDDEVEGDLIDAIKNGEDINPLLNEIEDNIGLLLNKELDEFLETINQFCKIIAINLDDGTINWELPLKGVCLVPSVLDPKDGNILFSSRPGFSLDFILDVNVNVTIENPKDPDSSLKIDVDVVPPEIEDVTIIPIGFLSAINTADGSILWSTDIDDTILLSPVFDEKNERIIVAGTNGFSSEIGHVLFGSDLDSFSSRIHAINKIEGSIIWTSELFNGIIGASKVDGLVKFPLLPGTDGSVYFTLSDVKAEDSDVEAEDIGDISSLTVIQAVGPDGAAKWEKPFLPEGLITSPPIINRSNDTIFLSIQKFLGFTGFVTDIKGSLISISPNNGTVAGTMEIDGVALSSPTIDRKQEAIYTLTNDFSFNLKQLSFNLQSFVYALELD